jgi:hypothetical protein
LVTTIIIISLILVNYVIGIDHIGNADVINLIEFNDEARVEEGGREWVLYKQLSDGTRNSQWYDRRRRWRRSWS